MDFKNVGSYFWRSEGWHARHEALLEAVTYQGYTVSMVDCDANMEPDAVLKLKWFGGRADVSTCRSKDPDGIEVGRVYDYVAA